MNTSDALKGKLMAANVLREKDMIDMFSEYCRALEDRIDVRFTRIFDEDK